MKRTSQIFPLLVAALFATSANAALIGTFELVGSGQTTLEAIHPDAFDVYHFTVTSTEAADIVSLDLSFMGNFLNVNPGTGHTTFKDGADLPSFIGNAIPQSFFVMPAGGTAVGLPVNVVDNETQLSAQFTTQGSLSLIDAGGSAVVATLVTPAGAGVPTLVAGNGNDRNTLDIEIVLGGTGGDGPIVGPGGALDFGYNGHIQTLTLSNTGDEAAEFIGAGFELSGPNLGLFSLLNPDFSDLPAGADRDFQVLFSGAGNAQASYEAELTFLTNGGNPSYLLTAQVPEPSTVALAGLGMVGLVGLARRRRK